jgi:hypothetical protein
MTIPTQNLSTVKKKVFQKKAFHARTAGKEEREENRQVLFN